MKFKAKLLVSLCLSAWTGLSLAANWKIADGEDLGIRQIYEDTGTLVLQFSELPAGNIVVTDAQGQILPFHINGRMLVLPRYSGDFTVTADAGSDRIVTQAVFRREAGVRHAKRQMIEQVRQAQAAATTTPSTSTSAPTPSANVSPDSRIAPQPTPVVAACAQEQWEANVGSTLHDVIEAWTQKAGWHLVWQAEIDYPISAPVAFTGCYADAISALFGAYTQIDHPFEVQGMTQQKTLVVSLRK